MSSCPLPAAPGALARGGHRHNFYQRKGKPECIDMSMCDDGVDSDTTEDDEQAGPLRGQSPMDLAMDRALAQSAQSPRPSFSLHHQL